MNKSQIADDILYYVYRFIKPYESPVIFTEEEGGVDCYTEEAQKVFDGIYDILDLHENFENTETNA